MGATNMPAKIAGNTPSGRRYLKRQQEKHWKDILQPSDPRFDYFYGTKRRKMIKELEKDEQRARDEHAAWQEHKLWKQKNKQK